MKKLFVCLAMLLPEALIAQNLPPAAAVHNVTDDYFGTKITDPYRWMEDGKSLEMQQWMKAQANHADNSLQKMPLRAELLKRLNELSIGPTRVGGLQRFGTRFFYRQRAPSQNIGSIMVRDVAAGGTARVLIDLDKKSATDKLTYSIDRMAASPDGKYLAYGIFSGGSENSEIRVLEIATGKDTGLKISNEANVQSWLPDSKGFTYTRPEPMAANAKPEQREEKMRVRLHRLGTDPAKDREIFGYGVNPNLQFPLINSYAVTVPVGSKYVIGWVNPGVTTNYELYFAPLAALTDKTPVPWHKIGGLEDEVFGSYYSEYEIGVHSDDLYLATTKNAPRGKIIRVDLKNPDLKQAEIIFADSTEVVNNMRAAKDALYVLTLDGGEHKLHRIDYVTKKSQRIEIPAGGSVFGMIGDAQTDGLVFGTDSWVSPEKFLSFNPKTNYLDNTRLTVASAFDSSDIVVTRAKAPSHDGTLVPMVIIHRKNLRLDGTNLTLLDGYGSYGVNHLEPTFKLSRLAWLERGGVLVRAGVRGGGEYGEDWRLGGFQATKPNTWKDFIACAEYLIKNNYTSPAHLAGWGGSSGGILINNAIVERPELFAAAVASVGLSNTVRFETTSNGIASIVEYGSVKDEAGFKSLLAMDAYHKVTDGVKYPAMLFVHGANDRRVEPWLSAKMASRLQAATTGGKPVLLRINYDGGHFGGSNVQQANELQADIYAFLFEYLK